MKIITQRKRVLLLRGWFAESSRKQWKLESRNLDVVNPLLNNWLIFKAVAEARRALELHKPDLIVGVSRGGAVAMKLQSDVPMVLMAPAWSSFRVKPVLTSPTTIIHYPEDSMVRYQDSQTLVEKNPGTTLVPSGHEHMLNSHDALDALIDAVERQIGPLGG